MQTRTFVAAMVVAVVTSIGLTYYITSTSIAQQASVHQGSPQVNHTQVVSANTPFCDLELYRESDFSLIKPVLFADDKCESPELASLKNLLTDSIRSLQSKNQLSRASVYFRDLEKFQWTSYNAYENFHPGSMLKISVMINILKQAETDPHLFARMIKLEKSIDLSVKVDPATKLIPGQSYSVLTLLQAMIFNSDNDATTLLHQYVNLNSYNKMFQDLHLKAPEANEWLYSLSAVDFSRFYRILYNASYLNRQASEYALKLLSESKFHDGIIKYLPANAKAAHKFGERTSDEGLQQFHESGIVYINKKAYLLVIMTEGNEMNNLIESVANISAVCYQYIENKG